MTKKSLLRAIAIPAAAIAAVYGAVTFVGCSSKKDEPPPPPQVFRGNVFLAPLISASLASLGTGHDMDYTFMHDSISPQKDKVFVVLNVARDANGGTGRMGATNGTLLMYMLDAAKLEQGQVSKLAEKLVDTGNAATVTFRSNWSQNGDFIVMGGKDQVYVIAGKDFPALRPTAKMLDIIQSQPVSAVENHDALPTTDGKYAILTLNTGSEGLVQLYDINNNALVGGQVSACYDCHGSNPAAGGVVLCGIDGRVSEVGTTGTYSGTVYIAGHGGHIAKLGLDINPAAVAPAEPIRVSNWDRLIVSSANFAGTPASGMGRRTHKLHDVRLDGNTLYWSTFNLDANNKAHYGKINADGSGGLVDIPVSLDARATVQGNTPDTIPIYCASGITDSAYFPCTMTNEAYITVIPKGDIK